MEDTILINYVVTIKNKKESTHSPLTDSSQGKIKDEKFSHSPHDAYSCLDGATEARNSTEINQSDFE